MRFVELRAVVVVERPDLTVDFLVDGVGVGTGGLRCELGTQIRISSRSMRLSEDLIASLANERIILRAFTRHGCTELLAVGGEVVV